MDRVNSPMSAVCKCDHKAWEAEPVKEGPGGAWNVIRWFSNSKMSGPLRARRVPQAEEMAESLR